MCGPVQSASLHRLLIIPLLNEQTNAKFSSLLHPLPQKPQAQLPLPNGRSDGIGDHPPNSAGHGIRQSGSSSTYPPSAASKKKPRLGRGRDPDPRIPLLQSSFLKLLSTRAVVVGCPCVLTGMPARPAMGRRRAVAESSNSNRSPDSDLIPFCPFDRLV